jgi:hypothetical protein
VLDRERDGVRPVERRAAGEQVVGDGAQGVDVAARVDGVVAGELLGRHVPRRPGRMVGGAGVVVRRARGDAEVGEQHDLAGALGRAREEHVLRLEVAVDDAVGVGVRQRVGERREQGRRLGPGEAPARGEPRRERLARGVRHRQAARREAVVERDLVVGEARHHARVRRQLGEDARLAAEALARGRRPGERRVQHLERDRAVEQPVAGEEHDAGGAAAQLAHHLVAGAEPAGVERRRESGSPARRAGGDAGALAAACRRRDGSCRKGAWRRARDGGGRLPARRVPCPCRRPPTVR